MPRKVTCPSCKAETELPDEQGPPASPETARFDVQGKLSEYDERLAKLERPAPSADPSVSASDASTTSEPPSGPPGVKSGFFSKLDRILSDD